MTVAMVAISSGARHAEGYEDFEQTIDVRPGEVTELPIRMRAKD